MVEFGDIIDETQKQLALGDAKQALLRTRVELAAKAQEAKNLIDIARSNAEKLYSEVGQKIAEIDAQIAGMEGSFVKRGRPKGGKNKVKTIKKAAKVAKVKAAKVKVIKIGRPKMNSKPLHEVVLSVVKDAGDSGIKLKEIVIAVRKSGYKTKTSVDGFIANIGQSVHRLLRKDNLIKKTEDRSFIAA